MTVDEVPNDGKTPKGTGKNMDKLPLKRAGKKQRRRRRGKRTASRGQTEHQHLEVSVSTRDFDLVIDGVNVVTNYNRNGQFQIKRLEQALELFAEQGKRAIVILPEDIYLVLNDYEKEKVKALQDSWPVLLLGSSIEHPKYHQYNVIDFGIRNGIPIVSNNKFRAMSKVYAKTLFNVLQDNYLVKYSFAEQLYKAEPLGSKQADK